MLTIVLMYTSQPQLHITLTTHYVEETFHSENSDSKNLSNNTSLYNSLL